MGKDIKTHLNKKEYDIFRAWREAQGYGTDYQAMKDVIMRISVGQMFAEKVPRKANGDVDIKAAISVSDMTALQKEIEVMPPKKAGSTLRELLDSHKDLKSISSNAMFMGDRLKHLYGLYYQKNEDPAAALYFLKAAMASTFLAARSMGRDVREISYEWNKWHREAGTDYEKIGYRNKNVIISKSPPEDVNL